MSNSQSSRRRRPWRPVLECLLLMVSASGGIAAQAPLRAAPAFPAAPAEAPPAAGTSLRFPGRPPLSTDLEAALQEEGDGRGGPVFLASLLGSYAGAIAGAFVGGAYEFRGTDSDEWFGGALIGGVVGGIPGAALGGNLADGPPRTFGKRLLAAGLVGAGGLALGSATECVPLVFSVPLLQAIAMVARDYD